MATKFRLAIVLAVIVAVTVLSWWLGAGQVHGAPRFNLAISAAVLFIALLKVRLILREFMEVGLAPAWVRRSSDAWLAAIFCSLFAIHAAV